MSKIVFSNKYKPLFSLLKGDYKEVDTILMYGGRDSGKTFAESLFIPIAVKDYNHRVLYTRYTMNSTDNSISEALNNRIGLLGAESDFEFANNMYRCIRNDGKILITGQKTSSLNQTAKLKSLENFSIFVTDEAEEIKNFEEWDKIKKSIRATDVRCLSMLVFNPPTKAHWLFTEFFEDKGLKAGFEGVKDNVLYIHTTYLDNLANVSDHNLRDYLDLKENYDNYNLLSNEEKLNAPPILKKKAKKYDHVVLGGFLDIADGVIYEDWEIGDFNDSLPYIYGIDFGFSDPDVLTKVSVDQTKKIIYVKEILYKNGLSTNDLGDILIKLVGRTDLIIGDSAHNRLINDLYYKGLNIRPCKKRNTAQTGSVRRMIKTIQGFTIVVTSDSLNVIKSLNNYCWHDGKNEIPRHDYKHAPDSFGYAVMEIIDY